MSLSIASTSHEQHFAMATSGHRWPLRLTAMVVVLAAFAAMWALVLEGHALLWQRLDVPVAAERYVVDHIDVPLPSSLGREEIASACAERPWPLTTHSIAACLTDNKGLLAGSAGEAAAKSFEQRALQQQWAAQT